MLSIGSFGTELGTETALSPCRNARAFRELVEPHVGTPAVNPGGPLGAAPARTRDGSAAGPDAGPDARPDAGRETGGSADRVRDVCRRNGREP